MENGIYSIVFKSSIGVFGGGLVVIEDGRIHGGNVKYIIKGSIAEKENSFEATSGDIQNVIDRPGYII